MAKRFGGLILVSRLLSPAYLSADTRSLAGNGSFFKANDNKLTVRKSIMSFNANYGILRLAALTLSTLVSCRYNSISEG